MVHQAFQGVTEPALFSPSLSGVAVCMDGDTVRTRCQELSIIHTGTPDLGRGGLASIGLERKEQGVGKKSGRRLHVGQEGRRWRVALEDHLLQP